MRLVGGIARFLDSARITRFLVNDLLGEIDALG